MKKIISILLIIILINLISLILGYSTELLAINDINYISLSDENITVNKENITTDVSKNIYLSNSTNNGGNSKESLEANVEISNVININSSGIYKLTGELSDGQISINSNNIDGEVIIILDNVNITCENAPAIFVHNTDTKYSNCKVIIKTETESLNTITGGRLKKSVEGWSDQESILYYIDKGNDDDGSYYEQYKYDGAISSDISIIFEGEGTLIVNSTQKEGIETKRDITFNSGNYVINSVDDGINASTDGESVITINGGTLLINLKEEAEEGDGIDSNGYLNINGGKVYAFASEMSQDSGLDSDLGININGGYVVGIGNMSDAVSKNSKQKFIQLEFKDKVSKGSLITIVDKQDNPIAAFESDRDYTVLVISIPKLIDTEYMVYQNGTIVGKNENGLYTEISSYEKGIVKEYSDLANREMQNKNMLIINPINNIYYYTLFVLIIIFIGLITLVFVFKKKGEFEMKGKILTLVIGIIVGAIITTVGFLVYNKFSMNSIDKGQSIREEQMQDMKGRMPMNEIEMPNEKRINGDRPEMPGSNNSNTPSL